MTPKLRLDHKSLVDTHLLWAKSFHLICSPLRCIDLVENILSLRLQAAQAGSHTRPLFIWEPVPDLCTTEESANCLEALKHVDIVSPNHSELGGFFGVDTNGKDHVDFRKIEALCGQWLENGIGSVGQGGLVVRAGKDGCLVARQGGRKWLPAYHQSADKVVDPTGGGNGFLGGLAIGLVRCDAAPGVDRLEEAAAWGSVSASFAIEQIGMPVLSHTARGETWNHVHVEDRLADYKQRLGSYVQP
jgi:sugar/nucleoside kinase (ribokinase family)